MFGSAVSKISFPNENFYVSPVYKKDKVSPVRKINNNKKKLKYISGINLSKLQQLKMRDIFGDTNTEESLVMVYDGASTHIMSDFLFMGKYIDDLI